MDILRRPTTDRTLQRHFQEVHVQLIKQTGLAASITAALGLVGPYAQASGFSVPEISILGLGTSNAVVANTSELGAIAYNPAVSAFHSGLTVSGGLLLVLPSLEVTTVTGNHESDGKDVVPIPMFQATYAISDQVTLGLGANAPFGLETDWDASTPVFPGFVGTGGHPTSSKIELVDIVPTVAFKIGPNTAVALGADYYYARKIELSADGIANEGDGDDGWGWNASLVHEMGDWSFGVSYHSSADIDVDGTSEVLLGPFTGATSKATAEVPLPWRAQAGIRYQASAALSVEFDITRTGWSSFDTLVINNAFGGVTSANDWDDANAYRLGAIYQLNPSTQIRFGYSFDETPQPRSLFGARVPDNDRHLFSIGVGHDLGNGLAIEGGYMYVKFKDYTHSVAGAGPVPGDPNGSALYNGEYESSVHLFGLGVTKAFN